MTTESGEFVIYKSDDAGVPEVHKAGKWYFEPTNWDGDVYSLPYETWEEALAAAEKWEEQQWVENASQE